MAEFLTTSGTSYWIEKIIIEAEKQLFLISPYLQISKTFSERLKDASNKGVKIIVIYGKDELSRKERKSLEELNDIELYFFENLHAKCYYNEKKMVITSMNMYEFSEKNNREMGILIDSETDSNLFKKAFHEAQSIKNNSKEIWYSSKPESPKSENSQNEVKNKSNYQNKKPEYNANNIWGFCIRCGTKISYNPNKPLCEGCYSSWSNWNNYDFIENMCHCCGDMGPSSMAKPLCLDCFSKN